MVDSIVYAGVQPGQTSRNYHIIQLINQLGEKPPRFSPCNAKFAPISVQRYGHESYKLTLVGIRRVVINIFNNVACIVINYESTLKRKRGFSVHKTGL